MDWVGWTLLFAAGLALYWFHRPEWWFSSPDARPVLPAHYDVQNYYREYATSPGWCPHCGTENDPLYRFCEGCSAKLPADRPYRRSTDLSDIFDRS